MNRTAKLGFWAALSAGVLVVAVAFAQEEGPRRGGEGSGRGRMEDPGRGQVGDHGRSGPGGMGPGMGMGHGGGGLLFMNADENKDGDVTEKEWRAAMDKLFKKADADGNGKISRDEARDAMPQRPPMEPGAGPRGPMGGGREVGMGPGMGAMGKFKEMDKNDDGKLTEDEVEGPMKERFAQFDADSDGAITTEEIKMMHQNMQGRMGGAGRGGQTGGPDQKPGGKFKAMDKNDDGKLAKDEATGMLAQKFDSLDANKDGFLDKGELKAGWAGHKGAVGEQGKTGRDGKADRGAGRSGGR